MPTLLNMPLIKVREEEFLQGQYRTYFMSRSLRESYNKVTAPKCCDCIVVTLFESDRNENKSVHFDWFI